MTAIFLFASGFYLHQAEPVYEHANMFLLLPVFFFVFFYLCVIKNGSSREDFDVDDSVRAQV